MAKERVQVFFETRASLRDWLAENHGQAEGVWALFYKKSAGLSDLSWEAIVEECLCFGWIDSLPGKVDEVRTKIYISPRKPNSGWSRRNKELLLELEAQGRIQDPGYAVIQRAKTNGSWERFDLAEALVLPAELVAALEGDLEFSRSWNALTQSKQRQALQLIYDSRTPDTRNKRIEALRSSLQ